MPQITWDLPKREEIAEYRHSVFEPVAAEAVHRHFRAVIEQFQPKQRHDFRTPKHADLVAANRGERN